MGQGRGELANGFRNGQLEVYPHGRYFTLTGNVWHDLSEIVDIQAVLDELVKMAKKPAAPVKQRMVNPSPDGVQEILARIRRSAQAGKFFDLYDRGEISAYGGDDSAADMALMDMLPFWTGGDTGLMLEIFNGSKLAQREKWQRRTDYRKWTIEKALQGWNGEVYSPEKKRVADKPPSLLDFKLTDAGNAERLKFMYTDRLLYVPASRKWLQWNGKQWKEDEDTEGLQVYDKAVAMLRRAFKEAGAAFSAAVSDEDRKAKEAAIKFFLKSENTVNLRNCITQAKGLFSIEKGDLDKNPYILNCGNGTLDLRTGELKPHDRKDYITKICRADYMPGAKSPLWEDVLQTILPDEEVRAWLKRFIGYSLFGLTSEEKFLFLYGPGGGGKGTFIESIAYVLGAYAGTMDIDVLLASRNDAGNGGQPTPQIAELAGKRLIITSESGIGRKFNDARIKLLTGSDRLVGRHLYANPFSFVPKFSLVMSSNYKPTVTDSTDEGMRRRMVIIPFMEHIAKKDIMLKEKLKGETKEAILAWCVEGALEWWERGEVGELPAPIKKMMDIYFQDNDLIGQFINECCETGEGLKAPVRDTHRAFTAWLDDGHYMSSRTFSEQMENRGFVKVRGGRGVYFKGLSVIEIPV
ncbi:phage/plasmid primase, P4 family [Selenomonas sp. AB3002]|uniref:phage/plasmid primase, P4 family n=1 Tax=Selenomonas sp. AB3002 TaxID=1392502 RepID=UPI0004983CC5